MQMEHERMSLQLPEATMKLSAGIGLEGETIQKISDDIDALIAAAGASGSSVELLGQLQMDADMCALASRF